MPWDKYRLDGILYWKDGNTIYESKNPDSPIGEILVTGEVKWLIEDFEEKSVLKLIQQDIKNKSVEQILKEAGEKNILFK